MEQHRSCVSTIPKRLYFVLMPVNSRLKCEFLHGGHNAQYRRDLPICPFVMGVTLPEFLRQVVRPFLRMVAVCKFVAR